eukprot:TRINITY_DN8961_c1_g1_i5.p1 TRINITY_DN8961_c1_g1~~TRINITY_DN8961_c1_g1_i5.p1  ORF type:complete len:119 (+),score=13.24 TRINITY_DN8961_c1_g1_i5:187-543(+)
MAILQQQSSRVNGELEFTVGGKKMPKSPYRITSGQLRLYKFLFYECSRTGYNIFRLSGGNDSHKCAKAAGSIALFSFCNRPGIAANISSDARSPPSISIFFIENRRKVSKVVWMINRT